MCASAKSPLHKELVDDGGLRTSFGEDTDTGRVSFSLVLPMRSQLPDRKRVDGRYQSRVAHSTGTQDRCRTTCSFLAARQEN